MRGQLIALSALSLSLGACGGSETDTASEGKSISGAEIAERAQSSAIKPQPGQYKVSMEVLEVDIPGAPPQAVDMMRSMMSSRTHQYCLSQDDVDTGFEEMARQSQEDGDCTFQRFDVDGGSIDAQMTCDANGQGKMTMTMKGEGTPTRSEMDMTMKGNMAGMGDSTIRMKATHERVGDCA